MGENGRLQDWRGARPYIIKNLFLHPRLLYYLLYYLRNAMFTTFSQQILSSRLLLTVIGEQKSNLSDGFKLKSITIYYL